MIAIRQPVDDPRIESALADLRALIVGGYPDATFDVIDDEDFGGPCLRATIDTDDDEAVMDLIIDRLLEAQVDEDLPVTVRIVVPLARAIERLHAQSHPLTLADIPTLEDLDVDGARKGTDSLPAAKRTTKR